MGIKLKNAMTAALAAVKSESLGSFTFLGSAESLGGKDGTMSYWLDLKKHGSILVDCGPHVFSKLYDLDPWGLISAIVLTSSEESSTGSLAAVCKMIHKSTGKPVPIICMPHIARSVYAYLVEANNMPKEMFDFHMAKPKEVDMAFRPLPSIRHSFKKTGETTSMFVMDLFIDGVHTYVVHSGWINRSAFDYLDENVDDALLRMKRHPENVVVLHDAVFKEQEGKCSFDNLIGSSDVYRNFFLYGHSAEEGKNIVFSQRHMRSLSTNDSNVFLIEKQ